MSKFGIVIHGGAGTILRKSMSSDSEKLYTEALGSALELAYEVLKLGGSAIDAVETAVISLEDCPLFNAGRGSVFTNDGRHEMDASIMDGSNLDAGSACLLTRIKNPIKLARMIMDKSEHVMLASEGAEVFALQHNIEFADKEYFYSQLRFDQLQTALESNEIVLDHTVNDHKKFGTVGAVACDQFGRLAAATSTGGMTNKKWGRIGDTPIIGSGTYANNQSCAISCTGSGEYFIRTVAAFQVHALMHFKNLSLAKAAETVIQDILYNIGGDGGLIGIDKDANICMEFNTEGMYRGYRKSDGSTKVEIYKW
ncbi:MAG: isoaspartyl peptidase/L-asparaginase [Saprospiraceae bacterium]